jgi:hypothetical protein
MNRNILLGLITAAAASSTVAMANGPGTRTTRLCDPDIVSSIRAILADDGLAQTGRCVQVAVASRLVYDENDFPVVGGRGGLDLDIDARLVYDENDFPVVGGEDLDLDGISSRLVYDENDFPVVGGEDLDLDGISSRLVYDENDFPVVGPDRINILVEDGPLAEAVEQRVRPARGALILQVDLDPEY